MTGKEPQAPRWAGRVRKHKIRQLYEDDARGMHDGALINDVAFRLLDRCKSMQVVEAARNGRAECPICGAIIEHEARKDAVLDCGNCGWTGTWKAYRASMDGLHLIAPGLGPFCQEYVDKLPFAKTLKEKMFWIDWLIHRCHWEGTALPGQPGAVCLIQGRAADVNAFLDQLTAGVPRSEGRVNFESFWSEEQQAQIRKWRKASERRAQKRAQAQKK